MKVTNRIIFGIALLALAISAPLMAQQQGQQPPKQPGQTQPPPKQPGQPGQLPSDQPVAPPVNKEEEDAFKAFFESKDDTLKAKLGEEFLEKFPESRYRETAYVTLAGAYQNLGQEIKMLDAGEKALALNPDNVVALVTMTKGLARRTDPQALDAQQKFDKAEKYGKHALDVLSTLVKPEALPEENFNKTKNDALADIHGGLGLIYLRKQRVPECIAELQQATQISTSPDPVDFYLLGFVLQATKRFEESATAFGRCAELPSALQETCKQGQADAKKKAAAQPPAPAPKPQ